MMRLEKTLKVWGTPDFKFMLMHELAQKADQLPLQQGLATGNYVTGEPITVMIHRVDELQKVIRVQAGIFYQGVISGCSCADDPSPSSESNEYCQVRLDIDKITAATRVALVEESDA